MWAGFFVLHFNFKVLYWFPAKIILYVFFPKPHCLPFLSIVCECMWVCGFHTRVLSRRRHAEAISPFIPHMRQAWDLCHQAWCRVLRPRKHTATLPFEGKIHDSLEIGSFSESISLSSEAMAFVSGWQNLNTWKH